MNPSAKLEPQQVLDFWFNELTPADWFKKSDELDNQIRERFLTTWQQAVAGELADWRDTLQGRLAEIIVIDQFSRNLWRDDPQAFAHDGMALVMSQELANHPDFANMTASERHFALMPMMHSESLAVHEQAVPLFEQYTNDNAVAFEQKHKVIIEQFGRYPHRNAILGRESTEAEIAFLQQPNSSF